MTLLMKLCPVPRAGGAAGGGELEGEGLGVAGSIGSAIEVVSEDSRGCDL